MTRVLISGFVGAGNLGDEAILAGLAPALRAAGFAPAALSAAPRATTALHDLPARHRLLGVPAALAASDALVSGGGGLLQDRTSSRSLRYYLGVLRLARRLGKRVVVFGQSVGPLSPAGRRAVAQALAGVPILVRDAPSHALLAELGLEAATGADPALRLASATRGTPGGVGGGAADRPTLLIPRADVPGAEAAFVALARRVRADGERVVVAALEAGADAAAAQRIAAAADAEVATWRDPWTAARDVAAARRVASVRLHGLILAAGAGVPHVGVGYDPKVAGFAAASGGTVV
ncbi:MAG: polysaccharide pyruvyl transferase family protein, partial [Trueperaceae bacterium]|nr:polysaccharide pyruvyl transferase family protein [Trueperaceae bacterium]